MMGPSEGFLSVYQQSSKRRALSQSLETEFVFQLALRIFAIVSVWLNTAEQQEILGGRA
jgi:hypothetical protein